jgi:hypothetical protein
MGANDKNVSTMLAFSYGRMRVLAGEPAMAETDRLLFVNQDPSLVYTGICKYLNHTNIEVRRKSVEFLGGFVTQGKGRGNIDLQNKFVKVTLIELDEDHGVRHSIRRRLEGIPYSVFDEELKSHIKAIHRTEGIDGYIIALYDIANMRECLPVLKSNLVAIVLSSRQEEADIWQHELQWDLCRLLAKWGDCESITNYVRKTQLMSSVSNKSLIYNCKFLREIRDPLVVQVLTNFLFNNYKHEVTPGHISIGGVASHSAQALSEMVVGFPISRYPSYFSDEELDVCRRWVQQQTNFVIKPWPSYSQE